MDFVSPARLFVKPGAQIHRQRDPMAVRRPLASSRSSSRHRGANPARRDGLDFRDLAGMARVGRSLARDQGQEPARRRQRRVALPVAISSRRRSNRRRDHQAERNKMKTQPISRRALAAGLALAPVAGLPALAGAINSSDPVFAALAALEQTEAQARQIWDAHDAAEEAFYGSAPPARCRRHSL